LTCFPAFPPYSPVIFRPVYTDIGKGKIKLCYRMILCDHLTINAIYQVMKLTTLCDRDKSNWFLVCGIRTEERAQCGLHARHRREGATSLCTFHFNININSSVGVTTRSEGAQSAIASCSTHSVSATNGERQD
jgi:hypothetical protein